jgi:hypothetical protein
MDKQITLNLPLPVVEWVLNLVNEQPRRVSDPVFQLIHGQTLPQVTPTTPDKADAEKHDNPGLTD